MTPEAVKLKVLSHLRRWTCVDATGELRSGTSELDSVQKPRSGSFAATTQLTQQPDTK